MASEIGIKLVVGAALAGSFQTVLGGAKKTVADLGTVAERLQARHERLGGIMARAMASPARPLGELRQRYEALGRTLDQIRNKTEALNKSMERGAALKARRDEKLSAMRETAGAALAVGAPVVVSVKMAAALEDLVKDIAITGEMTKAEEQKLGQVLRDTARQYNQHATEVGAGLQALVASGITSSAELQRYAPILAKAATATRASVDDLGNVFVALKNNLAIGAQDTEAALNMLAYAGKQGQFELKDMAKWMPNLAPMMQAMGVTGKEAVAELGAALQVARKGAGTSDEAANNLKNFLAKVTAPDTLKDFEKAGIDLKGSLIQLRAQGMTPMMGMLEIIRDYMKKVGGDGALKKFDAAAKTGDMEGVKALSEAYGLGTLFQDMQAMSFIKPAIADMAEFKRIKEGAMTAGGTDLLGDDFAKRMAGSQEQMKRFGILAQDIGLSVGNALLPPLVLIMESLAPVVRGIGEWAQANPGLVKTIVGIGLALTAGKLAVLGLGWAVSFLVLSPLNGLRTAFLTVGGRWLWLRGLWQAGAFAPLLRGLASVGAGFMRALPMAAAFGKGLWMAVYMPFKLLAQGGFVLARLLGGALLSGLRLAGQAVLFLGRALLMNPIGLAVTVIAGAAYLIWKNWDRLGPMFARLWSSIKAGAAAAWAGIKSAFLNFTPLGLVVKHWQPLMAWFRGLPAAFAGFGAALVEGLVNGIKNKLAAAGEAIKSVGASVRDTFKGMLGIRSPSRVFAEMGGNLSEGLSLGMTAKLGSVTKAAAGMAAAASVSVAGAVASGVPDAAMPRPGVAAGGGAGMVVHYAPVLNISAAGADAGAVHQEAEKALSMSLVEFEKMMRRYEADKSRRAVK